MSGNEIVKVSDVQIVNVADAREAMRAFEEFKKAVLTEDDFYTQGNKKYVRKSGWMKYAMALGIRTDVYDEVCSNVKFNGKETLLYNFTAKATAPNGRYAVAVGSASSDEGKPWASALHSIRAMAQTRAVERSISNLVGGGEVGAEEMDSKSVDAEYRVKASNPSAQVHDRHDEDASVSLEQDIIDSLTHGGLDPNGVEIVRGRDWGQFIIKPIWPKPASDAENPWRKYADALKPFGVKYWKKDDPGATDETRYNWTIGV